MADMLDVRSLAPAPLVAVRSALLLAALFGLGAASCASDPGDEPGIVLEQPLSATDPIFGQYRGTTAGFEHIGFWRFGNGSQAYWKDPITAPHKESGKFALRNNRTRLLLSTWMGEDTNGVDQWGSWVPYGFSLSTAGTLTLKDSSGSVVATLQKVGTLPVDTTLPVEQSAVKMTGSGGAWSLSDGDPTLVLSIENTSNRPYAIREIALSFDGGSTVTFPTAALVADWDHADGATNLFRLALYQTTGKPHLSSSLNDSGRIEIAGGDVRFAPFASGALRVVARGTLTDDNQAWEATTTLSEP